MMEKPRPTGAHNFDALQYCLWATNGREGREHSDPVVREVSEGRCVPSNPRYSSCGDLCHGMLYHIGVRLPWVNREEHLGWRVERNISLLFPRPWDPPDDKLYVPWSEWVDLEHDIAPDQGDILYMAHVNRDGIYEREHVCVANEFIERGLDPVAPVLETLDYGQPGGKVHRRIRPDGSVIETVSPRKVLWILPLSVVVDAADEAGKLKM